MNKAYERATVPEDLARLFVERANARDAVLAFPPGSVTVGREAIRVVLEEMLAHLPIPIEVEEPLPTVYYDDLALTSTRPADGTGGRVQVARRQPDGTWLRVMDRPEAPA